MDENEHEIWLQECKGKINLLLFEILPDNVDLFHRINRMWPKKES